MTAIATFKIKKSSTQLQCNKVIYSVLYVT